MQPSGAASLHARPSHGHPSPNPPNTLSHLCNTGAHPTDVRMTTRFKKDSLLEGLTGTVHETGHALYEQGRNLEYDGLPVNEVGGLVG